VERAVAIQLAYSCHTENCTGFKPDNTPFYFLFGSLVVLVIVACVWQAAADISKERLLQHGIAANADIKEITPRKTRRNGSVEVDLTLAVTSADGDVFEGRTHAKFPIAGLPQVGWTIPVRYSAKNRLRICVEGPVAPPADGHP
jgi:hypothetical protein